MRCICIRRESQVLLGNWQPALNRILEPAKQIGFQQPAELHYIAFSH